MTTDRIAGGGLRITALEIRNLWGVAEAVIRPGQRNIIRGANATGKTSILNALELALGGGTLGKYKRLGAPPDEEPEIVLEISGPSDHVRIERAGDKPPKVLRRVGNSEAFERVSAPATFLKGLFDVRGSNPFAFLAADDNDRAQLLLEALDLQMDDGMLEAVLGQDASLAPKGIEDLHPLVRIALIHDAVYSARRGCNVDRDAKQKAAEQLKRSVPADLTPDLSGEIALLDTQLQERSEALARREEANRSAAARAIRDTEQTRDREIERLSLELKAETSRLRASHDKWSAELRAEVERKIAEREKTVSAEIDAISSATRKRTEEWHSGSDQITSAAREQEIRASAAIDADREAIQLDRDRLVQLRERHEESSRHENTREQIAKFEDAVAAHDGDSRRLTATLRGLEDLKRQLAEKLPIQGLDISGKEIRVNGVPWRDLNKAQQGAIAGIVAVERAKRSRLPVVFFDEAEQFDDEHIDAIARIVESAGAQLFAAVVAREGEIQVEADGKPAGSVRVEAPADPVVK